MKGIKNLLLTAGFTMIWCVPAVSLFAQEVNYAPVELPNYYQKHIDLIYKENQDWQGRMDVYYPSDTSKQHPLVINVHGGGWNHGEKESQRGFDFFFERKFVVANVEYRLESQGKSPAAIQDVRCALIYLLNRNENLGIDPNKVILMGASAGGHLALMAGLLQNDRRFDEGCPYSKEIQIAAVIDKYGVVDLEPFRELGSVKKWLGDKFRDIDFVRSVSPINYISEESPAIFISHGTADPIVPYGQSLELFEALQKAGVKSQLISVENGVHGKFSKVENQKIKKALMIFLDELGFT